MYIQGINGYLSKFEGVEVDAAVERVQGLDAELALKVDKTTKINDVPLEGDITLTAEEIGALPLDTLYGKSLAWEDNILSLCDQFGRVLSNKYIEVDLGRWGHIFGNLSDQTDLQEALDNKQPLITLENMLSSDLVDDTGHVHKFATAEQLQQIATNTANIAINAANIDTNAANIAINTANIAINRDNIATNTQDIATNRSNIATNAANIAINTSDIATNAANIATNTTNIATNTANIATNVADIAAINGKIPAQASTTNQLADKNFVNSAIQTAAANFRGSWENWAAVPTSAEDYPPDYEGDTTPTVNDYMVVQDASDYVLETLEGTWRFKYTGNWETEGKNGWMPEYQVNESPFTPEQLAAINSGITAEGVAQITTNKDNISAINNTISGFGNIVTHNVNEFATAAQGAKADTALQSINGTMVTEALGYTPLRYAMVVTDYTI